MKTLLTTIIASSLFAITANAQTNTFPTTGNVGIGTVTPALPLHIYGTGDVGTAIESSINAPYLAFKKASANKWILILERNTPFYGMSANDIGFVKGGMASPSLMLQQTTGYVGIATGNPIAPLQISSNNTSQTGALYIGDGSNSATAVSLNSRTFLGYGGGAAYLQGGAAKGINFNVNNSTPGSGTAMAITSAGLVGINTLNPDQLLTVNGTVHAKSVVVDLSIVPDYVFKPTYKLPTLAYLKNYIDKNSHLPEVPAEAEVKKNGLDVGQMDAILLKKVEELTLYLIAKDQAGQEQKEINKKLKAQLKALQIEVNKLKKAKK